jgi:hypothetical protein
MAFPNLICLLVLSGVIAKECADFQKKVLNHEYLKKCPKSRFKQDFTHSSQGAK